MDYFFPLPDSGKGVASAPFYPLFSSFCSLLAEELAFGGTSLMVLVLWCLQLQIVAEMQSHRRQATFNICHHQLPRHHRSLSELQCHMIQVLLCSSKYNKIHEAVFFFTFKSQSCFEHRMEMALRTTLDSTDNEMHSSH